MEIRIIIAGSRTFNDYDKLKAAVSDVIVRLKKQIDDIVEIKIVSGRARGTDRLGERYGNEHGYRVVEFVPDWDGLGKKAGYIRNVHMAEYSVEDGNQGVLIAFWDGESRGTMHMINIAKKYGLDVHVVEV